MKAFIVERYGRKDGVRFGDMPEPELRDDDVLVRVHAAGVNLLDSKFRNGEASAAFFSFFALEPTRRCNGAESQSGK